MRACVRVCVRVCVLTLGDKEHVVRIAGGRVHAQMMEHHSLEHGHMHMLSSLSYDE